MQVGSEANQAIRLILLMSKGVHLCPSNAADTALHLVDLAMCELLTITRKEMCREKLNLWKINNKNEGLK